jgi:hypothetical protein
MRLASARFESEILLNRPRNLARPLPLIRKNEAYIKMQYWNFHDIIIGL